MDYLEKLKDPRWQKKRLEVFERDGWRCKSCGTKEKTLHLHHLFYFKDKDPWDINNGFLLTLCEECHQPSGDECWSESQIIINDIGILLNSIWCSNYDSIDLTEIAFIISETKRPIGPAWEGEMIVKEWEYKNAQNKILET